MTKSIFVALLLTLFPLQVFAQYDVCPSIAEDIRLAERHLSRISAATIRTLADMSYCGENWDICKRIDDPTYEATRRLTAAIQKIFETDLHGEKCRLCDDTLMREIVNLTRQVDSFNGLLSDKDWNRAPALLPNNWNILANLPLCSNRQIQHTSNTTSSISSAVVQPGCQDLSGRWKQQFGTNQSIWTLTKRNDGKYDAHEGGLGGEKGIATLKGKTLLIRWGGSTFGNMDWEGTYSWRLDKSCKRGNGTLHFIRSPTNRSDEVSKVDRL